MVVGGGAPTGQAGLQLLSTMPGGRKIIAVCGTASEAHCKALGADYIINYRNESVVEGLRRLKIKKLSVVYHCVHTPGLLEALTEEFGNPCVASIDPGMHHSGATWRFLWGIFKDTFRIPTRHHLYLTYPETAALDLLVSQIEDGTYRKITPVTEYPWTNEGVRQALHHVHDEKGGKAIILLPK